MAVFSINGTTNTSLGLVFTHRSIGAPEVKTNKVSIPLADGSIDLTGSISSVPRFENREIVIECEIKAQRSQWMSKMASLRAAYHGQTVRVIFSDDSSYYWTGRCSVSALEDHGSTAGITFTIDAEPFKRTVTEVYDETVTVSGNTAVAIDVDNVRAYPTFISSASMTVSDGVETFTITQTVNKAYGLIFREGTNNITISGSGTCRIKLIGGDL